MSHVLHFSILHGLENPSFMGPLGKGSWHEWESPHLVALAGMVWYNLSRSGTCTFKFAQFRRLVKDKFPGVVWKSKYVRPAETRWMVIWLAAKILLERWDELVWLHGWAGRNLLGTPFKEYWLKSTVMLRSPNFRLQAMFATRLALKEQLLDSCYNWIRTEGGRFLLRPTPAESKRLVRLSPGYRLAELPEFSLELLRRAEVLRSNPETFFADVLDLGGKN